MRFFLLIFLFFEPLRAISIDNSGEKLNFDQKEKIVAFYDLGRIDKALEKLKYFTTRSNKEAFFAWLNIAIIEHERYNQQESLQAYNQAAKIKINLAQSYLSDCYSIINNKLVLANENKVNLDSIYDPLHKLFLWQITYYMNLNEKNIQQYAGLLKMLSENTSENTIRDAKILYKRAILFQIQFDEIKSIEHILRSNDILEKLKCNHTTLYVKNIYRLFYFNNSKRGIKYNGLFSKYEKDSFLLKHSEIPTAINYYKAKYYYYTDIGQSLYFIKRAYNLDKSNPDFISFIASLYLSLKDYKSALYYFNELKSFPVYRTEAYLGAAKCAYNSGNLKLNKFYINEILKEIPENTSVYDFGRLINFLFYSKQLDIINRNTLEHYICEQPKNVYLGKICNYYGNFLWDKKMFTDALYMFHNAILANLPNENNKNIYAELNLNNPTYIEYLITYLNNKGEAFYQLSKQRKTKAEEIRDLKACYKNLDLSLEQIYKYKMQLATEEQKYLYSDLRSQKYPNIIKVCLELYNLTGDVYYQHQAFKFAEQGKASVMLSMMRSNNGSKIGLIPAKYKNLEDSLNMQITLINEQLNDIKGDNKYNLNTKLDLLSSQGDKLEQLYRKQYPSYYKLKYSSEVVNPSALQASLKEDECIVEFQLNRNFLISYYIDRKNLLIHTDTLRTVNLAKIAESFYNRINHFNTAHFKSDSIKVFATEGQKLYNILLKPFELKFRDKKIIVVADNSLRKIPFEALLTGKPVDMSGYRRMPYLIRQNVIYYAPSVTFLSELRSRPVLKNRARLLAVAPVYSSLKLNDTISRMLLAVRSDTSLFGSLPNAKREIRFANTIAGGRYLAEKRATETRFKKLAANFDIIHLATHGILDSESSLQSNLLFADSSPADDGFLHNYEIYNLQQSSQLVILSACNTGSGKNYGGEGVISTGRGFLSSGSRSVIMTLWPVNDQASYQLIKGFYSSLKEKASICDALRHSKLEYLDHADNMHSHPFFWTGYIVYGDASIELRINNLRNYYFIAGGILVLGLLVWMGRRTKNQEPRTKNQEPRAKSQEPGRKLPLNPLKGTIPLNPLKGTLKDARAKKEEAV